jgi:hypothetical protein
MAPIRMLLRFSRLSLIHNEIKVRSRKANTAEQSEPAIEEVRNRPVEVAHVVHLGL